MPVRASNGRDGPDRGNQPLRTVLTQLAHAASRTRGTYLSALYHSLAARLGKKRAIVAVAHSIVVSAFHMLSRNEPYQDLGATYYDEQRCHHLVDRVHQPLASGVNRRSPYLATPKRAIARWVPALVIHPANDFAQPVLVPSWRTTITW